MLSRPAVAAQRFDWQRSNPPILEPKLAFDTHFQGDGLPIPPHSKLLVGVSGGSDSIALLHLLHDWHTGTNASVTIYVATVDHGLRDASRAEAEAVAAQCQTLGLPHAVLNWGKAIGSKPSSQDARLARYALLIDHAKAVGATCLMLGHTKNDQAETVLMRALRSTPESNPRGLSAMTQWSHHASPEWSMTLYRPLLHVTRERLRTYLRQNSIDWIDDPTNSDTESERVRVRQYLQEKPHLDIDKIAQFASVCAEHRAWMSNQTARFITTYARCDSQGSCQLMPVSLTSLPPLPVVAEALTALIVAFGGKPYRVPTFKTEAIAIAWLDGVPMQTNLGRALINVSKHGLKISREKRGLASEPSATTTPKLYDGRVLLKKINGEIRRQPFIVGLENFLPSTDLPVRRAIMRLLNTQPQA